VRIRWGARLRVRLGLSAQFPHVLRPICRSPLWGSVSRGGSRPSSPLAERLAGPASKILSSSSPPPPITDAGECVTRRLSAKFTNHRTLGVGTNTVHLGLIAGQMVLDAGETRLGVRSQQLPPSAVGSFRTLG
jgi:hypothetical protein